MFSNQIAPVNVETFKIQKGSRREERVLPPKGGMVYNLLYLVLVHFCPHIYIHVHVWGEDNSIFPLPS